MAILRAIPLKDATATAVTSCGEGTVYDASAFEPGKRIYAGLHIVSCSTGGVKVRILTNSSSGYSVGNPGTVRFNFTCSAERTAEWLTPLTSGTTTSTNQRYWRAIWECTTCGETHKFLAYYGVQ